MTAIVLYLTVPAVLSLAACLVSLARVSWIDGRGDRGGKRTPWLVHWGNWWYRRGQRYSRRGLWNCGLCGALLFRSVPKHGLRRDPHCGNCEALVTVSGAGER